MRQTSRFCSPNQAAITLARLRKRIRTVHFYDRLLKGKIVVIKSMYTHCQGACPLQTGKLAQVQKLPGDRVGKDIFL